MAKLTKTQTIAAVAEAADLSKAQAKAALDAVATLACQNAADGFTIPGLGKVSIRQTKAREMVMRFGPREGETVQVPAKPLVSSVGVRNFTASQKGRFFYGPKITEITL